MTQKHDWRYVFIVLTFIVLSCVSLWYVRNYDRVDNLIRLESENGSFDLTGIDFNKNFVILKGDVSYIPGILTPEEFTKREDEAVLGNPGDLSSATSRIRIYVPDNNKYMLTVASIDFAHRAFVNGQLCFEAGNPAETADDFKAGYGQLMQEVTPENGVIELTQQAANFVHREGGGHSNIYFGEPADIKHLLILTYGPEILTVGLFAVLFFVHLVLFIVRRSYKSNLIFSLLCLNWMIRTGVTGAKVFYAMFPDLPWQLAFRVEYLTLPIAAILMILLIREVFPGIIQKWFVRTIAAGSLGFALICIMIDTVSLSWTLIIFEAFFTLAIVYLCIRFIMKVPGMVRNGQFRLEQTISLIGLGFFMIATINDALYHAGVYHALNFTIAFAMTGLAMLIFSFFQMTAMFYGTMREAALAHEREQRAEAEKERFSEMNRLKNAFYSDMSHEMKTPLTIIAANAQFAAKKIAAGVMDEETLIDMTTISDEAKRLAQIVTNLVGIGRMQESEERALLDLKPLIAETARVYQLLFTRKKNTLTTTIPSDLPLVEGNADQFVQVLINLLANANRHTNSGTVNIRAEAFADKVKVSVIDNGEGIAPDLLSHVFERYCHGDLGGSGLGLSICKAIIEEYGGEIGIASEENKGTTVWFILPVYNKETDK